MILNAVVERLKRRFKDTPKGPPSQGLMGLPTGDQAPMLGDVV